MPETLFFLDTPQYPIFVSADSALLPSGDLDPDLFSPGDSETYSRYLNREERNGCVPIDLISSGDTAPATRSTFAAAIQNSDNVVIGTVTGQTYGFFDLSTGTLLRISIDEEIKGQRRSDSFVFYPVGDFHLGAKRICQRNRYYSLSPQVGDQVLILFNDYFFNDKSDLIRTGPTGVLRLRDGKVVDLPRHYRETDPFLKNLSKTELLQKIRQDLRHETP